MPALSHRVAERHLSEADPDMAALIRRVGRCRLTQDRERREPYDALVRAVVYQQLHGRAAAAILGRLEAAAGGLPSAEWLLEQDEGCLRGCGLSARKAETLQGLARARLDGTVPSRAQAARLDDEKLIARLISLKGVGRWTVEMLLMFTLGRPDVMPVDDFGVREGWRRIKGLDAQPKPRALLEESLPLAPWRSVATWYLWRASEEGRAVAANVLTG
ncbi:DNA-3-methyladenine glycosylase [Acetobacter nitrogenifigens DSM 23921 = NBRC 105050]|uniref:DNA-3-methyladenine glycosylase II n=1 Tax=Acetobacter nitrogenifigens DSM 23921 = NBRC 105050 TaxID=1120919 RepID=A0A511XCU0_9PROT|nr:DNA-3-methyladenine glycosylase [Acetobacter nitrogenifigens]GBQ91756.1 DNA-3-methyladenine glycosylase [Acetobacter nitrogenifigens DSM 23921 = NBRC 105050]GEN60779.1 DNA-3-methyladenine glycosylase [Acetobacter nitrogenifigens DSM 23921 = NBRC 105050]